MKFATQLNPTARSGEWAVGMDVESRDGGSLSWRVGEIIKATAPDPLDDSKTKTVYRVSDRLGAQATMHYPTLGEAYLHLAKSAVEIAEILIKREA